MRLYATGEVRGQLASPIILKVTTSHVPRGEREDYCALVSSDVDRFAGDLAEYPVAIFSSPKGPLANLGAAFTVHLSHLSLSDGDVLLVHPSGFVRILYRRLSPHNAIFVTDQCNSRCLMCSQPPKDVDDSHRIWEHLRLVDLIDSSTEHLGMTGGEPTLFGDNFLRLISHCKVRLPRTSLHVLSNGRLFYYAKFAERLARIQHQNLVLGIPIYSDIDYEHDYIVQAKGAFDQTVIGLLNLARYGVSVEIRVVLHRLTYRRLPKLAEFIYRNLPFARHVALMGMEMVGYVHKNLDLLWMDPYDYRTELETATLSLARHGMNVSIYNLQLCVLPHSVWPYARRSISDWKNVYLPECADCSVQLACAGFFQSGTKRKSAYIRPFSASCGEVLSAQGN